MYDALAPVEVFCSYAHEDESYLERLHVHLSMLSRERRISAWHDRQIVPGTDWTKALDQHLNTASVVLLLVSPDFIASDYCYEIEMQRALQRHDASEARVIPILVRPCEWKKTPIARLQCLPRNGKPVTKWGDQDDAWNDVAVGIRKNIENFAIQSRMPVAPRTTLPLDPLSPVSDQSSPPVSAPLPVPNNPQGQSDPDASPESGGVEVVTPDSQGTEVLLQPPSQKKTQRNYLQQLSKLVRTTVKTGVSRAKPLIPIFLYSTAVLLSLLNVFLRFNILDLVIFLKKLMRVNPASLRLTAGAAFIIIIGAMVYYLISILRTKKRSQSSAVLQNEITILDGASWYRKALTNVVGWSRKALAYRVIIGICFIIICIPLSFSHSSAVETGVGLSSDNPRIGVCDGFCTLDTDRLTGKLKQQAANYFRQKQDALACQYLHWAALGDITGAETTNKELNDLRSYGEDTTDAEAKIDYENRCTNIECPCISFVVTVQFVDQGDLNADYINGVSRSILQGAYLQQKKWNGSHANPPMYLFIANISAGDPAQPEIQQAQQEVADQILRIQQRDQEHIIAGTVGLPFGINAFISKLNDARIPMVSIAPLGPSDSRPYLFSVAPSMDDEVNAMANFCSGFQKIEYYYDQNDAYSQRFTPLFRATLNTINAIPYTDLIPLANQVAASNSNLIIFIGPVRDTAIFLIQLRKQEKANNYQSHTVLTGDNLYQWVYKYFTSNDRSAFNNVYFVAFAYPQADQLPGDHRKLADMLDDFRNTFDPGGKRSGNIYTSRRASSDAILAYDALSLLLNAQKNTTCTISCDASVWGETLQHYVSTNPFKDASGQLSFKAGSSVPDSKFLFILNIRDEKNGNLQNLSGRY